MELPRLHCEHSPLRLLLQQQPPTHLEVDVGVEHLGDEADGGWGEGVLLRHIDGELKDPALVGRVLWRLCASMCGGRVCASCVLRMPES